MSRQGGNSTGQGGHVDEDVAHQARDHILQHYDSAGSCKTAAIADKLGISTSYLCHRYRQTFGRTIGQEVRALRIRLAQRLLLGSDRLIKEIAADVGYGQASYRTFMNAFRAETGVSPSRYRRLARLRTSEEANLGVGGLGGA